MMKQILSIALFFSLVFLNLKLEAQITYKDVAPVFIAHCTSCHHEGGLQFPLTQYSLVRPWGSTVLLKVQNGTMPPWPADPTYRHYAHERVLTSVEKSLIIDWVNQGMAPGDTMQAPPVPVYGKAVLNGTPDLIIKLPKFTSTASASDHYYCMNVASGLTKDRYIRAFEFIPGNPSIIHHAVITIDTTGTATDDFTGGCYNFQGQINIGDFAPGMGPTVLPGVNPVKFGFRLKANSKFSFQIHVPEGTDGMKDSSELRVYLYPENTTGIRDMFFETVLQNWTFSIPANAVVKVTQRFPTSGTLPTDFSLYGAFPHSHNTCTAITNYAYKGVDTIPLVRINKWDFHWQGQYTFKQLVHIPTGYRLFSTHTFDNTVNNPLTPDHNKPVAPGTSTTDEMLFDSYLFTPYMAGDELVNLDSLLALDPLLRTGTSMATTTKNPLVIYPNPASDITHINNLEDASQIFLYDLYGHLIYKTDVKDLSSYSMDVSDYPSGMYVLVVSNTSNATHAKLSIDHRLH